jgi:hypothetical protein
MTSDVWLDDPASWDRVSTGIDQVPLWNHHRAARITDLEAQLRDFRGRLRDADQTLAQARADLDDARHRRWGRRDHTAIHTAERRLDTAENSRRHLASAIENLERTAAHERHAQRVHDRAMHETAGQRAELTSALDDIDAVAPEIAREPDVATILLELERSRPSQATELHRASSPDWGPDLGL